MPKKHNLILYCCVIYVNYYYYFIQNGRWVDGNPSIYTEWYEPEKTGIHVDAADVLIDDKIEEMRKALPSRKQCTMVVRSWMIPGGKTEWLPVPCNRPYSKVSFVCKMKYKNVPSTYSGTTLRLQKKKSRCPKGFQYIGKLKACFSLLSSNTNINHSISCSVARKMCTNVKGHLAYIGKARYAKLKTYLDVWKHVRQYGGIWLAGCAAIVGREPRRQLQTKGPHFVWVQNGSESSLILNALCQSNVTESDDSCSEGLFTCNDGTCILEHNVCDGAIECSSGEDEERCSCNENMFVCEDGTCMSPSKYCDGIIDCKDESDERNCSGICMVGHRCQTSNQSLLILPINTLKPLQILNYTEDIMDPRGTWFTTGFGVNSLYDSFCSRQTHVRCNKDLRQCFNRAEACLYDTDFEGQMKSCKNGEHIQEYCRLYECPNLYKCKNAYCIPFHKVCDGIFDCPDGSEELNCKHLVCPGLFKCKIDNICLDQAFRCDGIVHCKKSMEDERFCEYTSCPSGCHCNKRSVTCKKLRFLFIPAVSNVTSLIDVSYNLIRLSKNTELNYPLMMKLNLANNLIHYIPLGIFSNLSRLLTLDLQFNYLNFLSQHMFQGLSRLQNLFLKGNTIEVISHHAFAGLQTLSYLNLNNLGISDISDSAFVGLSGLSRLTIRNNSVTFLTDKTFDELNHLEFLDLTLNHLESIEPEILSRIEVDVIHTDEYRFCCFVLNSSACYSPSDMFSSCSDLISSPLLQVAIWVLAALTLIGNTVVIVWRIIQNKYVSQNVLIVNLAISDLLMGIYLIIVGSSDVMYRNSYARYDYFWRQSILCKMAGVMSTLSSEISTFTLTVVSTSRLQAVAFPLSHIPLTPRKSIVLCLSGWVILSVLSIIPLIETTYFEKNLIQHGVCLFFNISVEYYPGWEFMLVFLLLNFASCIYMLIAYAVMLFKLWKARKACGRAASVKDNTLNHRVLQLVLTNAFCWIPIIIVSFVSLSGISMDPQVPVWMIIFVLPLNSALNPYLYSITDITSMKKKSRKSVKTESNILKK